MADLVEQLREALQKSPDTVYAIGKLSGVDPGQISRFMSGERSITLPTAAKLAEALGLELRPVRSRK